MIDFKTIPERYQRYYTYLEPVMADPLIRGYFGLVASFLLVTFFLVFALSPTINTILSLRKKIVEQQTIVKALDNKISSLITAQENYSQVEPLIPVLDVALPSRPVPQVAITQLVETATPSGVTLSAARLGRVNLSNDLSTTPSQDVGSVTGILPLELSALPVSVSISGSKTAVHQYLKKIENSLRYIRFNSLSFIFDSKSSQVSVDAVGLTYYYVR